MILEATILFAASLTTPVPAAATAKEQEIVVLARKLRDIKFKFRADRIEGKTVLTSCKVTKSTKDKDIDAIPCAATAECVALQHPTSEELIACTKEKARERISDLADRRAVERGGG